MAIYSDLGVPRIINAKGPSTRVSGGFLDPEVLAAMAEAATQCVDMAELQAAASRVIARVTGAEAGIVTSGAAAGLLLGTAACVAGLNPALMGQLPNAAGPRPEVIVVRSQRNAYDHAVRAAGVYLVEVGLPDRYAGAGVRDAEPWEIAAAITPATVAILYVASSHALPSLAEVVAVAHERGVPVIVDAAAQLPPVSNLQAFLAAGADLVAFSGGKAISGPQGSGILCGRRDLIMSAILQNLDLDLDWEQWNPPVELIDKHRLPGLPTHGIGRTCKVGKETIVGLLVALERFAAESDVSRTGRWQAILDELVARLGPAELTVRPGLTPRLVLAVPHARQACFTLQNGSPAVHVDPCELHLGNILINPTCLQHADLPALARALRAIMIDSAA